LNRRADATAVFLWGDFPEVMMRPQRAAEDDSMDTETAKMGRRPSAAPRLDYMLAIPITEAQREQLRSEATRAGYRSLAEYVRQNKLAGGRDTATTN
jgi:hypothetical protein